MLKRQKVFQHSSNQFECPNYFDDPYKIIFKYVSSYVNFKILQQKTILFV